MSVRPGYETLIQWRRVPCARKKRLVHGDGSFCRLTAAIEDASSILSTLASGHSTGLELAAAETLSIEETGEMNLYPHSHHIRLFFLHYRHPVILTNAQLWVRTFCLVSRGTETTLRTSSKLEAT
ncbi:hypothetical protein E2C01_037026 [Portunus trituberculatus]|uniref:Uncharacterized protein n=1 Tax=Portunus trituberculatus TaxID=210409 RepID=A0A5B7FDN4_PORTR|nr:hypothetical protein [Portunus trituberculatus]